jgi:hypothetical protein
LRIASFYRRKHGSLVRSPIPRFKLRRNAFIMLFLIDTLLKVTLGRETAQGKRKISTIKKPGKITYKEISIMSIEEEIGLPRA